MRCVQSASSECLTPAGQSRNMSSNSTESREGSVGLSMDKLGRGGVIPISIKFKKTPNQEALSKHGELHRGDYRRHHELRKTSREPLSTEIANKRLKVRGPSGLGYEGRLN